MALVGVASALQQVEAISEALEQKLGREQLRTGGCKLERQREPIEALAELADRGCRLDVWTERPCSSEEQIHSLRSGERR